MEYWETAARDHHDCTLEQWSSDFVGKNEIRQNSHHDTLETRDKFANIELVHAMGRVADFSNCTSEPKNDSHSKITRA